MTSNFKNEVVASRLKLSYFDRLTHTHREQYYRNNLSKIKYKIIMGITLLHYGKCVNLNSETAALSLSEKLYFLFLFYYKFTRIVSLRCKVLK